MRHVNLTSKFYYPRAQQATYKLIIHNVVWQVIRETRDGTTVTNAKGNTYAASNYY